MASQREITKNETLIEFKHTNGYVKLAKIESRPIDVYGLYHLNRRVTVYVIQYSSNGINWSTAAEYRLSTKHKMHKHFHEACKALRDGLKIKSTGLICAKI
jgi:hypothetical protein